jgi:hypothetical protein
VLNNLSGIDQCKDDGYLKELKDQEGEGCHIWGQLTVSTKSGLGHMRCTGAGARGWWALCAGGSRRLVAQQQNKPAIAETAL